MSKSLKRVIILLFFLTACGDRLENPFDSGSNSNSNFPSVLSLTPGDGFTDFPVYKRISVIFNKSMDPATITTNVSDTTCSGTLQVSSDGFSSCIQMGSAPISSNSDMTFEIVPLTPLALSTLYQVRVTTAARDSSGNRIQAEYTMSTGFTTASTPDQVSPFLLTMNPDDGEFIVPVNTPIYVTFNEAINPLSVTTNLTGDTNCSGTFQVSSNGFTSCIEMVGDPQAENGGMTFSILPSVNLSRNTQYQIRVTTGVTDLYGNPLFSDFTSPTGFTTSNALDVLPPEVVNVDPYDLQGGVSAGTSISVRFSEPVDPSSMSTNFTGDTSCSGSFQVSSNGFSNCVEMAPGSLAAGNAYKVYRMTPVNPLPSATYRVRITNTGTTVSDINGNALVNPFTTAIGFTVP